jgi:hypothetical protein
VLGTLTEKDFQEAFQNGGDGGTGFYMREETTSRVMAVNRPYGEFYDFYSVSPEYFRYYLAQFSYIKTDGTACNFCVALIRVVTNTLFLSFADLSPSHRIILQTSPGF